ncbi:hypothetical protein FN846DRAFT_896638 [Sphaerosporella brunnea]|uniref:Aminoglycoside phosphotransferase domain-containing protein n=1 Tax=Sphaerosporella brunnea TaxID=1250544 RepID=A0A5J5EBS1_9PEZI|nr:hypothetical protein FN846DRAFT_896638 [Sphaerosporella brunnea]
MAPSPASPHPQLLPPLSTALLSAPTDTSGFARAAPTKPSSTVPQAENLQFTVYYVTPSHRRGTQSWSTYQASRCRSYGTVCYGTLTTILPFADEDELNERLLLRLKQSQSEHYMKILCDMIATTFRDHRCVFTHGDLQFEDTIVERVGGMADGSGKFKVTLLDWAGPLSTGSILLRSLRLPSDFRNRLKRGAYRKEYPSLWHIRRLVLTY